MLGGKRHGRELRLIQTVEKIHIDNENRCLGGRIAKTSANLCARTHRYGFRLCTPVYLLARLSTVLCPMKTKTSAVRRTRTTSAPDNSRHALLSPPKLTSWLAANAGISLSVAEQLWLTACDDTAKSATPGSSEFFGAAIDRLAKLIDNESTRRDLASFGFRPWARYQARLLSAGSAYIGSCRQLGRYRLNALANCQLARRPLAPSLFHLAGPVVAHLRSSK